MWFSVSCGLIRLFFSKWFNICQKVQSNNSCYKTNRKTNRQQRRLFVFRGPVRSDSSVNTGCDESEETVRSGAFRWTCSTDPKHFLQLTSVRADTSLFGLWHFILKPDTDERGRCCRCRRSSCSKTTLLLKQNQSQYSEFPPEFHSCSRKRH